MLTNNADTIIQPDWELNPGLCR